MQICGKSLHSNKYCTSVFCTKTYLSLKKTHVLFIITIIEQHFINLPIVFSVGTNTRLPKWARTISCSHPSCNFHIQLIPMIVMHWCSLRAVISMMYASGLTPNVFIDDKYWKKFNFFSSSKLDNKSYK